MPVVFMSYSHVDRVFAEALADNIEKIGYDVWIDHEGIAGGDRWEEKIYDAIEKASVIVVLLTPESLSSEWVRKECDKAKEYDIRIVPLMIRPCNPLDFLQEVHYIDFCRLGFKAGFTQLCHDLPEAPPYVRWDATGDFYWFCDDLLRWTRDSLRNGSGADIAQGLRGACFHADADKLHIGKELMDRLQKLRDEANIAGEEYWTLQKRDEFESEMWKILMAFEALARMNQPDFTPGQG